jgi:hypothetical protein
LKNEVYTYLINLEGFGPSRFWKCGFVEREVRSWKIEEKLKIEKLKTKKKFRI